MIKVGIKLTDQSSDVLAFADVSLETVLVSGGDPTVIRLKGFRVIKGRTEDGKQKSNWVSFPSRKDVIQAKVVYHDTVIVEKAANAIISAAILKAHNELKSVS